MQGEQQLKFYDEKEWRYLPECNTENEFFYLTEEGFNNVEFKKKANEALYLKKIEFTYSDIKFLVVPHKSDVQPLVDFLQNHVKYKVACLEIVRRVITVDEIEHDF